MNLAHVAIAEMVGASLFLAGCGASDRSVSPPIATPVSEGPATIQKYDGDRQSDTVLATLPMPLRVLVSRPKYGGTVPVSSPVKWLPDDRPGATTSTNQSGIASYIWILGAAAGEQHLMAQVEGSENLVVHFYAGALPGRPTSLERDNLGTVDLQVGVVGEPLFWDYFVYARDAHGNQARGVVPLDWAATVGAGTVINVCGVECWCHIALGECMNMSIARHVLGPREGANEVTATASSLPGAPQVKFSAFGVTTRVEVRAAINLPTRTTVFVPESVTVIAGQSVGWHWVGDLDPEHSYLFENHSVVFEDDPSAPTSSAPRNTGGHVRKFSTAGIYRYRCAVHSSDFSHGEVGVVAVQNP